ncbi:nitrite reductase small subunit NirD [Nocardioides sp. Kera G14]|uniref:nitrite reductase small subunit NirD n=1 Tax=Nocardioides sp. Kera G14 TaxID=2884264 RepID=UPI001D0F4AF7|nr:nitrite reductase small subunit NirD [Nocardioides sp. Kera G14]UDY23796.1 nitrite reductase small subunit NirD [Nocardioides sp. Kera G14]
MTSVCPVEAIDPESGVAALVGGEAVAVFRTKDDHFYAISNYDPFGRASVLSRGIVGTRTVGDEEVPFVASPLLKQAFDLRTGVCLDDPAVTVPTYDVVVSDGLVLVGDRVG